jgi:hypothetical protein
MVLRPAKIVESTAKNLVPRLRLGIKYAEGSASYVQEGGDLKHNVPRQSLGTSNRRSLGTSNKKAAINRRTPKSC